MPEAWYLKDCGGGELGWKMGKYGYSNWIRRLMYCTHEFVGIERSSHLVLLLGRSKLPELKRWGFFELL